MRVARGLLALPPDALVPAQMFLLRDPDAEVRQAAKDTVVAMPPDLLLPVLKNAKNQAVLDGAARTLHKAEDAVRTLLLNNDTADDTVRWLAGVASAATSEMIARNQVRAVRFPAIIEALYLNPRASQGNVQNLLEFAVRENLALDHIPGFRETKALLLGEERDDALETGLTDSEFSSAMLMAAGQGENTAQPAPEDEKRSTNLVTLISKMSVAQKVRIAMVGDAMVRKLLIRDPKKMVALAVLKSPRLTDGEITAFASTKSISDEILALICRNRQWTKDYATRRALVFNPKTPVVFSMSFLRTLTTKDIKDCSSSREVNQVIGRTAKRIMAGDKK
jgi:hypothetical protein